LSLLFLLAGAALFLAPTFIPDSGRENLQKDLVSRIADYQLSDELQSGLFRSSRRSGDTKSSFDAAFYGASIVSKYGKLKNEEAIKNYVQTLESKNFNHNIEEIYQGVSLLKSLGVKDSKKVDRQYENILALSEKNSGFRSDSLHSASVGATYYAFKAIEALGKTSEFEKTEAYTSAIAFVNSLKDAHFGGYSDTIGQNATLSSTFHAIQVLPNGAYDGVEQFVYLCQAQDGGFSEKPLDSLAKVYYTESDVVSTIQGLYIIQQIAAAGASSPYDSDRYATANTYLNSKLKSLDLKETHAFFNLIEKFKSSYGSSRSIVSAFHSAAIVLIFFAVYSFYKPQIPEDALVGITDQFKWVLGFLLAGVITLQFAPQYAVIVYFIFSFYLAVTYYEAQKNDTTDGLQVLIATLNSMAFIGLVISLVFFSPFVYAQSSIFNILIGWSVVSSFVVSYVSCYFIPKQRASFFAQVGYLAWVSNMVLFFMYLYGRGDMDLVYRLVTVRGAFPLVFVGFPFVCLITSFFFSTVGYLLYVSK